MKKYPAKFVPLLLALLLSAASTATGQKEAFPPDPKPQSQSEALRTARGMCTRISLHVDTVADYVKTGCQPVKEQGGKVSLMVVARGRVIGTSLAQDWLLAVAVASGKEFRSHPKTPLDSVIFTDKAAMLLDDYWYFSPETAVQAYDLMNQTSSNKERALIIVTAATNKLRK